MGSGREPASVVSEGRVMITMSTTIQQDIEARLASAEPDVEVLAADVLGGAKVRLFIDHPEGVTLS